MWDLTNGKLLRTITDAHPPGSAVLHVKVDEPIQSIVYLYCVKSTAESFLQSFN